MSYTRVARGAHIKLGLVKDGGQKMKGRTPTNCVIGVPSLAQNLLPTKTSGGLGFERNPDFHPAHTSTWVELRSIEFQARRFRDLQTTIRDPMGPDRVDRLR